MITMTCLTGVRVGTAPARPAAGAPPHAVKAATPVRADTARAARPRLRPEVAARRGRDLPLATGRGGPVLTLQRLVPGPTGSGPCGPGDPRRMLGGIHNCRQSWPITAVRISGSIGVASLGG